MPGGWEAGMPTVAVHAQCLQYQYQCPQFAHREAAVGGEATNPRLPTRPNLKCDKIDLTDHAAEMVVTNNGFSKENDPD